MTVVKALRQGGRGSGVMGSTRREESRKGVKGAVEGGGVLALAAWASEGAGEVELIDWLIDIQFNIAIKSITTWV